MEEGTKKALMIGVPLVIGGAAAVIYFATRKPEDGLPPGCTDGEQLVEVCPDGSQIVTHTCQGGQWIPTGQTCPTGPPGCTEGDQLVEICPDGTEIVTHICQGGQWVPTGQTCPTGPPPACQEGEIRYEFAWEKKEECEKTNVTFKCENGRGVCIMNCNCKSHPPEWVNNLTSNHMWVLWRLNRIWHVQVEYFDHSSGYFKSVGIPYNGSYMSRLMKSLNYLRDNGKINDTQYQNGILQGQNMGFQ